MSLTSKTRTHRLRPPGHAVSELPANRNSRIPNSCEASNAPNCKSLSDKSTLAKPLPKAPLGGVPENRLPLKSKSVNAVSRSMKLGSEPAIRFGSTSALGRMGCPLDTLRWYRHVLGPCTRGIRPKYSSCTCNVCTGTAPSKPWLRRLNPVTRNAPATSPKVTPGQILMSRVSNLPRWTL